MSGPAIAELRHVVSLEAPGSSPDGAGGVVTSWEPVAILHAALRPSSGSERLLADGIEPRITGEIWLRHRDDVRPEMRFVLGSRVFDIHAVIDPDERRRWLRCLVAERRH